MLTVLCVCIPGVKAIPTSALDKISFMPCLTSDASHTGKDITSPKVQVSCGTAGNLCRVRVTCSVDTSSTNSQPRHVADKKPPLPVKPLSKPCVLPTLAVMSSNFKPSFVSSPLLPGTTALKHKGAPFLKPLNPKDGKEEFPLKKEPSSPDKPPVFVFGKTVESKKEPSSPDKQPTFVFGKTVEKRNDLPPTQLDALKVAVLGREAKAPPRPCSISLSVQPDWGLCGKQTKLSSTQSACQQSRKRFVTRWDGKLECSVTEQSHTKQTCVRQGNVSPYEKQEKNCLGQSDKSNFLGHRLEPCGGGSGKMSCVERQSPTFLPIKRHLSCESQDSGLGPSPCRCEDCLGSSLDSVFEICEADEPFVGTGGTKVGRSSMFYVDTLAPPENEAVLPAPETSDGKESQPIAIPEQQKLFRSRATIQVL